MTRELRPEPLFAMKEWSEYGVRSNAKREFSANGTRTVGRSTG
jgi:hypothetical protein